MSRYFKKKQDPGHTTNLSDLLSVDVVQRQSQHVQSSLGRHILVLCNNLDEHVLENLYERQVIKSTLVNKAFTLNHQSVILKATEKVPKVEECGE